MSILIPGMELPKDGYIDVRLFSDGGAYIQTGEHPYYRAFKVIELPPHGRLGDLDALTHTIERVGWYHQNEEKDMVHGANPFLHQAWYKEQDIYRAIEGASTIIPEDPADPEEGGSG